ncbi:MAG: M20 family metallopeptidase [Flavobacteriales bacterium]
MIDQIKSKAREIHPNLIEVRRRLHRHPELSFQEFETSKFIQNYLHQLGVEFQVMADTGIVAHIQGTEGGKVVALRADMDALPIREENNCDYRSENDGVMHACGHDVHTTSLLGVAEILQNMRLEFKGIIKLIFQPGEEKLPGGASLMIKAGALENPKPKGILGQHVYPELEAGKVGFRAGKYMASADEIYLKVIGKGGHAALPDRNIDPVLIASHIVVALQQVVSRRSHPGMPTVLSFGRIIGEGATNVIPDVVNLAGTFRTFDEEWRMEAHSIIEKLASETAMAMGAKCEVDIRKGYPFVLNDEELTKRSMQSAIEFLGRENVIDLEMRMTGEDFSYYTQQMPGCFYRLGTKSGSNGKYHGLHTPTFDVDENCLETGCGLMTWLCLKELES